MSSATTFAVILAAYALTLVFTFAIRNLLLKRALFDEPNERSLHKAPVPRGGGWALLIVLVPGMLLAAAMQKNIAVHAGVIAGTILLAFVSWLDDRLSARGGASIGLRLSAHIFAACIGSLGFAPDQTLFGGALPFWLDRVMLIVAWTWFINLYNFMDGIDGITGVETVAIATGVCLILSAAAITDGFAETLALILIGAGLGFLVFNWHPAKIFPGDVGSVPLGYLTGFLLITLAVKGQWAPALALPLYYLADSGITLAGRTLKGEKVWHPHRQHFYQRAARRRGQHDRIALWIAGTDILLIGAAAIAVPTPWAGLAVAAVVVAILLKKMHK